MIVITGSAGFIGSCLVSKFNSEGISDLILVDDFSKIEKEKNSEGKKFKQKNLKDLILKIHTLPLEQQKEKLLSAFNDWKNLHEQIDDVSVIGFRV